MEDKEKTVIAFVVKRANNCPFIQHINGIGDSCIAETRLRGVITTCNGAKIDQCPLKNGQIVVTSLNKDEEQYCCDKKFGPDRHYCTHNSRERRRAYWDTLESRISELEKRFAK